MATMIGINGFGRIGRQVFKAIQKYHNDELEVVAINDLHDAQTNAQLLKYDSNYGKFPGDVQVDGDDLMVNGKLVKVFAERDPGDLPWADLGAEIVIESTGIFRDAKPSDGKPGANSHIVKGGAKKVIISAPAKNEDLMMVLGVNDGLYDPAIHHIVSNASCTTNCVAPLAKVLNDSFGIVKGLMTTVHSYTNGQRILDLAHKDPRRARAAAVNIIPTTTGAARAVGKVLPELEGKLDGFSLRVPTPTVSLVDLVVELEKDTTVEEVNAAFQTAADGPMKNILAVSYEPLVSMDYKGNPYSSTIDADLTSVMRGNMVKIISWYDNEWGYSSRTADMSAMFAKKL